MKNLDQYEKLTVNDLSKLTILSHIRERIVKDSGREDYIDYEIVTQPKVTRNKSEKFVQFGAKIIGSSFPCSTTATLSFFCNQDWPDLYKKVS